MSPAYVDRIGRAFEMMVKAALLPTRKNLDEKDRVLRGLFRRYAKEYGSYHGRLKTAVQEATARIRTITRGEPILAVEGTGESRKGVDNVDLTVKTKSGLHEFSLKLYRSATSVNLWNPTVNSLFKHLTGKRLLDLLPRESQIRFLEDMRSLKQQTVKSRSVTNRWMDTFVTLMEKEYRSHPREFQKNLCARLGLGRMETHLLALVVDEKCRLRQVATEYPPEIKKLLRSDVNLKFRRNGVSIEVVVDGTVVTRFSIYAASGSAGRTGGLRCATWTPGIFSRPGGSAPVAGTRDKG